MPHHMRLLQLEKPKKKAFSSAPNMYQAEDLFRLLQQAGNAGKWYPARPLGFFCIRRRFKIAWEVFVGRADAVKWPGGQ